MYYEEFDPAWHDGEDPVRTVHYIYWKTGDVSNIIIKDTYTGSGTEADYDWYYDMAFTYTTSGQVWQVLWDKWKLDGQGDPTDYTKIEAQEFRYDSPRARYLSRPVDTTTFQADNNDRDEWLWTDYDGVQPYGDFQIDCDGSCNTGENVVELMKYLPGVGRQIVSNNAIAYAHSDLIGSTVQCTDSSGDGTGTAAYTAFGELIGSPAPSAGRYQYAGAHGYESGLLKLYGANPTLFPLTLQHLGARWYQPTSGRFVQRDPLGYWGGRNVYEYCGSNPVTSVDATGFKRFTVIGAIHYSVIDQYQDANGNSVYVVQLQVLKITYDDRSEISIALGAVGIEQALVGLAVGAVGGPLGLAAYYTCVGVGLGAAGIANSKAPPTEVERHWEDVGPPMISNTRPPGFPLGLPPP